MEKGSKSESYHFYAHSYWYYPIFLVVYFPPLVLLVIYLNALERYFGGSVMAYILLGTTIIHYYILDTLQESIATTLLVFVLMIKKSQ